jgi:N-acetylglutamate synthase-like GNAT family acetyltransferase
MTLRIKTYTSEYKNEVGDLISNIQRNEFGIQITLEDQPDLNDIEHVYQSGSGNFWVAVQDDDVVGTVALIDIGNSQAALRKMFVAKEYRGKEHGVSQKLLNEVIAWCRAHRISEIYLGTVDVLKAAQRFYEKNGFKEIPKTSLPSRYPVMEIDSKFYAISL